MIKVVFEKIIVKWKTRDKFTDKSSRPNTITYSLSYLQQLTAIAFCSS